MHEKIATRRMSIETLDIFASCRGLLEPCEERMGFCGRFRYAS